MHCSYECLICNLKQTVRIMQAVGLSEAAQEAAFRDVMAMLSQADYTRSSPYMMSLIFNTVTRHVGRNDVYREKMDYYNKEVLSLLPRVRKLIEETEKPLFTALQAAVAGNLIDFAPARPCGVEELTALLESVRQKPFTVDDSALLFNRLSTAKKLLYIGDNCGEIALDKLFIEYLKQSYPQLEICFGVRGAPIINDVTRADALQVGMQEVATIIDSGIAFPGTDLCEVSAEFKRAFYLSDLVIAKGQGNYETLNDVTDQTVFCLFLVKCAAVSAVANAPIGSIICAKV